MSFTRSRDGHRPLNWGLRESMYRFRDPAISPLFRTKSGDSPTKYNLQDGPVPVIPTVDERYPAGMNSRFDGKPATFIFWVPVFPSLGCSICQDSACMGVCVCVCDCG